MNFNSLYVYNYITIYNFNSLTLGPKFDNDITGRSKKMITIATKLKLL